MTPIVQNIRVPIQAEEEADRREGCEEQRFDPGDGTQSSSSRGRWRSNAIASRARRHGQNGMNK